MIKGFKMKIQVKWLSGLTSEVIAFYGELKIKGKLKMVYGIYNRLTQIAIIDNKEYNDVNLVL